MIDAFPPFQTYGGMDQDTYILPHDNVNTPLDESQRQPASATIWRHDNLNNFEHPSLLNNDAEYIYDTLSQAGYFDEPKRPYSYTHFMTFGPYDLLPGEKCKVVIAYVGAQGANSPKYDDYRRYPQPFNFAWMNLVDQVGNSTISFADRQREIPLGEDALFRHFQRALNVYAWGYDLPNQPPNVKVSWSSDLAGQNVLTWTAFGENAKDPDYESQEAQDLRGYRIYRSTQENQGPWELVTEFPFEDAHAGLLPNIQYEPSDVYRTNPSDSFPEGIPLRENQYVSGMASNAGPEIQGVYRFVDRSSRAGFPNWYSIRFYDSGHNDWQWKVDDDSLYQPARLVPNRSLYRNW